MQMIMQKVCKNNKKICNMNRKICKESSKILREVLERPGGVRKRGGVGGL
jgi:hypothetical protein